MPLATVGAPSTGSFSGHVAVLAGVTLLFFLLAVRRMHGSGFRLLGTRPARTLATAAAAGVAVIVLSLSGVFGGKQAATEAATAATDATSAATGTPAQEPPAGVAAPDVAVISDFDNGSAAAAYGIGW